MHAQAVESVPGLIGFPYSRLSLARPSEAARGVFEDVTPDFLIKCVVVWRGALTFLHHWRCMRARGEERSVWRGRCCLR